MLRVGMQVVCVRGGWDALDGIIVPKINAVYTIRTMEYDDNGELFLKLIEIVNPPAYYTNGYCEASFLASGFRPVVERKTDISSLQALLNPSDELIEELWGAE